MSVASRRAASVTNGPMNVYTAKMLEMPSAATATINQTPPRRSAPTSLATERPRRSPVRGSQASSAAPASRPRPATAQNRARQPAFWPMSVPSGDPAIAATVRPLITVANARPPWPGPYTYAATTAPAPKNAPCTEPVRNRKTTSAVMSGAIADSPLPTRNSAIRPNSNVRRLIRAASTTIAGEPIMTPTAYAVIAWVATGIVTPRSAANSWMMPLLPNSPVPIAKVPSASANSVRFGLRTRVVAAMCRFSSATHSLRYACPCISERRV
jgi:hypothetical protein